MKIIITAVEGSTPDCGKPHEVDSFEKANELLRTWSHSAPANRSYDKCTFSIKDETVGLEYSGRYDLKHGSLETANLKDHVIGHLEFLSGRACRAGMDEDAYRRLLAGMYKMTQVRMDEAHRMVEYLTTLPCVDNSIRRTTPKP